MKQHNAPIFFTATVAIPVFFPSPCPLCLHPYFSFLHLRLHTTIRLPHYLPPFVAPSRDLSDFHRQTVTSLVCQALQAEIHISEHMSYARYVTCASFRKRIRKQTARTRNSGTPHTFFRKKHAGKNQSTVHTSTAGEQKHKTGV